jgi:phytoene desaturase
MNRNGGIRKEVIIIGAGLGGLTCGAILAKAGLDVLVLEARAEVGGCCHTTEQSGYRFEDGALWLSMDYLCRDVFSELGADFDEQIPTIPLNPSTDCVLPGGEIFRFSPSREAVTREIERLSPADVPRFHWFMHEMASREQVVSGELYNNPLTGASFLKPQLWRHAPFLLDSYGRVLRRAFRDERVRLAFARPTLFLGLPPSRCPAPFILWSYGEITSGSSYPKGGMGSIPLAVKDLLMRHGGELALESDVDQIVVENKRAVGVRLKDGMSYSCRAVISNVHVQRSYLDLIGEEHLSRRTIRRLQSLELGHSYFGIQLGLDSPVEGAANIPLIPSFEEMGPFWHEVEERVPKRLYPNVAIVPAAAGTAPPGGSVVSVYHVAPPHHPEAMWETRKDEFADRLLTRAEEATGLRLRGHVVTRRMITPADLEGRLRLPRGAMYGLSPTLRQSGPFRPGNRSPRIGGLYLVGQTTNPGLGVASVMASGSMTARLVLRDIGGGAE